jgi:sugar phosphate isomerase/epimerase
MAASQLVPPKPREGGRVLTATTSHKREPLLPTLELFGLLGLRDIDLNLHHILETGLPVKAVAQAVAAHGLHLHVVSGGWCDFFHRPPEVDQTFASVARQVAIGAELGVSTLRLFFGRLRLEDYTAAKADVVRTNLSRLSDMHPSVRFVFENHDGASLVPAICRTVLERVGRANIRMNFDPINFERAGVPGVRALAEVRPFVAHVHLKGLDRGSFCEFGAGDVDLMPVLQSLADSGYRGRFTIEYEGPFDGTLRLYQSVQRARAVVEALFERHPAGSA